MLRIPTRALIGVDVSVYWTSPDMDKLGEAKKQMAGIELELSLISSKGLKVYPDHTPGMHVTDQFCCRYKAKDASVMTHGHITVLLERIHSAGFDFIKIENLYSFDGKPGYSMGQGE